MENTNEALTIQGSDLAIIDQNVINQMAKQYELLKKFTQSVLEKDKDYGNIPGVDKPSLYQSGAISLKIAYGLSEDAPVLTSVIQHLEKNPPYVEYVVRQDIRDRKSGKMIASAMASCNSYEDKYRYRWIPVWKLTEEQKKIKDLQPSQKRKKKGTKDEYFVLYRFENDDVYSQFNTILQMAEKRAFVRAIRQAVPGASKLYTQDVEDLVKDTDYAWDNEETKEHLKDELKVDYIAEITRLMEVTGITSDGMKSCATKYNWRGNNTEEGLKERYEYLLLVEKGPENLTPEAPQSTIPEKTEDTTPKGEIVPRTPVNLKKSGKNTCITQAQADELVKLCGQYGIDVADLRAEFLLPTVEDMADFELQKAHNFIAKKAMKQNKKG